MKTPHKYAELIKAWADGAEIQVMSNGKWIDDSNWPSWNTNNYYRIKPETKPDVVYDLRAFQHSLSVASCSPLVPHLCWPTDVSPATLRLIFDGETGKLKSAEVL